MTEAEVNKLIEEFRVPQHVRRHCATVTSFALELGKKLQKDGESIDLLLLGHAAKLHDLVRVVDFKKFDPSSWGYPVTNEDVEFWKKLRETYRDLHHAEAGARILESRGFTQEATLVRKHRYLQILEGFNTWEEKLLYYADKRAKHDRIVSLKERLEDGISRNAPEQIGSEESKKIDAKIYELEKEIMDKIGGWRGRIC